MAISSTEVKRPETARSQRFGLWLRRKAWRHAIIWLAVAFALYPVVWIISA